MNKLRLLFIIQSIIDVILSWFFINGPEDEVNVIVKWLWVNGGFLSVINFKLSLTIISLLACEQIPKENIKYNLYLILNSVLGCTLLLHLWYLYWRL